LTALPRLAIALRTIAAATLVVLAGAVPVRLVTASFDPFEPYPGHTANYGVTRPRAIRAALPAIVDRPEKTALVLGSSGLARAFVPAVFDTALAKAGPTYVSFNLAQMLLLPETALGMAKTIRQTYEAKGKRAGIVVFGTSVADLTRDGLRAARRRMPDQAFAFETVDTLVRRAAPNRSMRSATGSSSRFSATSDPSAWVCGSRTRSRRIRSAAIRA
jgi:hypothetical protein